ncbi:Arm DNA-binding domain-containing protein [Undibacterium fentianense]|uniref:DUF4102 domain-containing protein n=1 Tax=Undibacterium fentianense TaxID=2828728 RepID=A0A941E049_9BURK|nr:Arm DNA-binding domain-containing protein [Undibacterium fentianense]MBR7798891.1 DUF4102 domain-containing protein [Undibacterium fentianense]
MCQQNKSRQLFYISKMNSSIRKHKVNRINSEVEFETCLAQKMTEFNKNAEHENGAEQERKKDSLDQVNKVNDQKRQLSKAKINLGDGLFLLIGKHGEKTFHYRLSMNGIDTSGKIGDYPGISFDSARKISDNHRAEISKFKNDQKLSSLKLKIKERRVKTKKAEIPCFFRLAGPGILYENLLNTGIASLEFKAAALLILLLPTHSEFLLNASRSTYDLLAKTITIRDSADRNIPIRFQVPDNLANIIQNSFVYPTITERPPKLFPNLSLMSQKERQKILASIYADECIRSEITLSGLRDFFAFATEKYGGFNKDFIRRLTNRSDSTENLTYTVIDYSTAYRNGAENYYYHRQEQAAISWFADQILRGNQAFDQTTSNNIV